MSPTCTLPFSDRLSPGKAETLFHGTPILLRGSRIFAGNVFDNSNIYGSQQNNNGSSSITAEHVVIGYLYTLICHLPDLLNPRPRAPRALTHGSPHHPDPGPRQSCRPAPGPGGDPVAGYIEGRLGVGGGVDRDDVMIGLHGAYVRSTRGEDSADVFGAFATHCVARAGSSSGWTK
ncbi:hypothetical protein BKA67DRAFT_530786 [Truncatella angustata]|uniref:Uncharacterized protein n=1 Tax=Truncatella angustata TaxID=152316 RepID=A0A9P8UYT9_9PEZI|nr:uncharacterized protein BKA67DRAFT_530786 [Truncatella angustata]KAH6660697.1 hypothetical protein BKA67DRAFT_530786 [Truncatella angustata]